MRILVYPHDLAIGGSQINAIELAAAAKRHGHEVTVFGVPGPLVGKIRELGLDFVPSPEPRRRPSLAVMRALARVVRERGIDVVHGYEWPPAMEAALVAARLGAPVVSVSTVMSMAVARFLPRTMPLLVGTEQIAAVERAAGRRRVSVLEPPVDLHSNHPGAVADGDFRTRWGVTEDSLIVVMVTRLAHELKLEGLLAAMDTVGILVGEGRQVQLVVVGAGPAGAEVAARAAEVNRRYGADVIVLTGELTDPRPAYAAADIVLGMGGSAMRAMAFSKPLVVQGENGFWKPLTNDTAELFLWTGWYGVGPGQAAGAGALRNALLPLLESELLRKYRGRTARDLVARFSLDTAADRQVDVYRSALAGRPTTWQMTKDGFRTLALYAPYAVRQKWRRVRGTCAADDFNSRPVVADGPARPGGARRE